MENLEQFAIWAFYNLHFDVASKWVHSRPVALPAGWGGRGCLGCLAKKLSCSCLDSSLISLIGIGGLRVPWELPDLCSHSVVMGSEEQSYPNDWVVFRFLFFWPQDPNRSLLFSFLVDSRFVFVYMVCVMAVVPLHTLFFCEVLLLGNRKYPLPKGKELGHSDFTHSHHCLLTLAQSGQ